jgi:signal transduction histidine kinase
MTRLYLRIYVALLASLVIFAVLAAAVFKVGLDRDRAQRDERALIAEVVAQVLPPPDAPADEQRAALARWQQRSGADLALFDAQRRPIASAGRPLPPPRSEDGGREARDEGWDWSPREGGPPVWSVRLPDGRWAVARPWNTRGGARPFAWGALLAALALAVALGAYPLARRLTRRLERLQAGVEALGAGDLTARVPVQGRDEIARLAERFNAAAGRIEALVSAQRTLLANASHELRSPLARLRMAVSLLSDAGVDSAARRAELEREVERNVGELDALIDEILLASRLDAGVGIAAEPVDLLALLAEECARTGAGLSVAGPDSDTDRAGTGRVTGDARLLRRLLRNLLENARRHGAGSAVEASLQAGPGHVVIEVCDRGPGVPEAERERIFEPFHRLAGHGESAGGVGLGLALARQIAHRHGARLTCLPREGGGSCFRVSLPVAPATPAPAADAPRSPPDSRAARSSSS